MSTLGRRPIKAGYDKGHISIFTFDYLAAYSSLEHKNFYSAISASHWAMNQIRMFWYLKNLFLQSIAKQVSVPHKTDGLFFFVGLRDKLNNHNLLPKILFLRNYQSKFSYHFWNVNNGLYFCILL